MLRFLSAVFEREPPKLGCRRFYIQWPTSTTKLSEYYSYRFRGSMRMQVYTELNVLHRKNFVAYYENVDTNGDSRSG